MTLGNKTVFYTNVASNATHLSESGGGTGRLNVFEFSSPRGLLDSLRISAYSLVAYISNRRRGYTASQKKNDLWHSVLSISKALSDFCLLLALSKKLTELKNATFHHLSFRSLTLSVSLDPQQSKPTTHYPETNVTEQYM